MLPFFHIGAYMSTEKAVQPFDMQAVQQRVQESIKSQFAMLIGDAAFDKLVEAAIQEFFYTEKSFEFQEIKIPNPNGYHTTTKYVMSQALTPFQAMVWQELQQHVRNELKAWGDREATNIKAMVSAVFDQHAEEKRSVFHLNVNDLALEMAARAHADLINQAATNTSFAWGQLKCNIDQVRQQLNLPIMG